MNEVQDKKAELTLNLSVIVQTLLLASTIGFGAKIVASIDTLTIEVGKLTTTTLLHAKDINYNSLSISSNKLNIEKNKIAINELKQRRKDDAI